MLLFLGRARTAQGLAHRKQYVMAWKITSGVISMKFSHVSPAWPTGRSERLRDSADLLGPPDSRQQTAQVFR
jgi:hypothetical protein